MDLRHTRIAQIALSVASDYGFALAGGYAVSAHGMGRRLSGDVDLFTEWPRRADFPDAVDEVINELIEHGYKVDQAIRTDTFARLLLIDKEDQEGEPDKLELSVDWRAHPTVKLDVGPVLHPDDAVANKMCALFSRAEARDFLDVDAAIHSGRYTRDQLLDLAAAADGGFDRIMFAGALSSMSRITDADFENYGQLHDDLTNIRTRFAEWATQLRTATDPNG